MSVFRSLHRVQHLPPITRATRTFSQTASNSVARITLLGHLGAPPDLVPSDKGGDMVRYSIATNYGPNRTKTSWFRVAFFPKPGDKLKDTILSLPKGSHLWLEGDAVMHKYEDADGKTSAQLRITQRRIEFLDRRLYSLSTDEGDSQDSGAQEGGENEAKEEGENEAKEDSQTA